MVSSKQRFPVGPSLCRVNPYIHTCASMIVPFSPAVQVFAKPYSYIHSSLQIAEACKHNLWRVVVVTRDVVPSGFIHASGIDPYVVPVYKL